MCDPYCYTYVVIFAITKHVNNSCIFTEISCNINKYTILSDQFPLSVLLIMCTPKIINIFSKVGQSVFAETDFVISITEVTCLVLQKTGIFQFSMDHKKSALKCCQWLDGDSDIYSGSRIQCSFGKQYKSEHLILFYYWDSKTQLTIFFFVIHWCSSCLYYRKCFLLQSK